MLKTNKSQPKWDIGGKKAHLQQKLLSPLTLSLLFVTLAELTRQWGTPRLPPMWLGFDSQIRRQMWVEFVGSLLCTERFSPGTPVSPLLKNQNLT